MLRCLPSLLLLLVLLIPSWPAYVDEQVLMKHDVYSLVGCGRLIREFPFGVADNNNN